MNKNKLRQSIIVKLQNISREKKREIEKQQQKHLFSTNSWRKATCIGITISKEFEWDTKQVIESAWNQNKHICVPKCYPNKNELIFYKIEAYSQLEVGHFDLLEPKPEKAKTIDKTLIDLIIVPGLLFDSRGYRVGFGGGYYDRYLVDYLNNTLSLASSDQIIEKVPINFNDIPVKEIITEDGLID